MSVTAATWLVALAGIGLMALLAAMQAIAVARPRDQWTITNVYGGEPDATDPTAYFAFNQGLAWADAALWAPLQFVGSIGMLLGERWGFLLALAAAVPYVYTAVPLFIWDRDLSFRRGHWVAAWAIWPAFGLVQFAYCFARLA